MNLIEEPKPQDPENLNITEQEREEIRKWLRTGDVPYSGRGFRSNKNLRGKNEMPLLTPKQQMVMQEEIVRCVKDPVYFINNYCWIISLKKGKQIIQTYPKQNEMINSFINDDRIICLASRQVGKTTAYCCFLMWLVCFKRDQKALILANKLETATEFLSRIRLMYELLPKWIKPSIKIWNKRSLEFHNDCKIVSSASSPDAARGQSCNILIVDEAAHIPKQVMEELWTSVYPIVSSSMGSKVIMVSTPNGANGLFYETYKKAESKTSEDGFKNIRIDWWEVPGRNEEWKRKQIASFNFNMNKWNQEFGNVFLGSSCTLIDGETLASFNKQNDVMINFREWIIENNLQDKLLQEGGLQSLFKHPKVKAYRDYDYITSHMIDYHSFPKTRRTRFMNFDVTIWHLPQPGRTYVIGGDISDGSGGDYTILYVFDITNVFRIKQVAMFESNRTPAKYAAYILAKMGVLYNSCPIFVERNDMGSTTLSYLVDIFDYDNIISLGTKRLPGIKSNNKLKVDACANMRDIFENPKIKVELNDHLFTKELETFERRDTTNGLTYKAATGNFDDRVMALAWALYILKPEHIENFFDCQIITDQGRFIPINIKKRNYSETTISFDEIDRRFGLLGDDIEKFGANEDLYIK